MRKDLPLQDTVKSSVELQCNKILSLFWFPISSLEKIECPLELNLNDGLIRFGFCSKIRCSYFISEPDSCTCGWKECLVGTRSNEDTI
jgi:hypothetical protein